MPCVRYHSRRDCLHYNTRSEDNPTLYDRRIKVVIEATNKIFAIACKAEIADYVSREYLPGSYTTSTYNPLYRIVYVPYVPFPTQIQRIAALDPEIQPSITTVVLGRKDRLEHEHYTIERCLSYRD
jgi:hypothetical protein